MNKYHQARLRLLVNEEHTLVKSVRRSLGTGLGVHIYLLARQGVHILEYHNQEALAEDQVSKFAYILGVNKIRGATAGTVLRPIGIV